MQRIRSILVTSGGVAALAAAFPAGIAAMPAPTAGAGARSPAAASAAAAPTGRATVSVRSSRFGKVLFDGRGFVLYLFTRDRGKGASRCSGACAEAWPPFLTKGAPRAGKGARKGLLGTTRRADGTTQVTYRGHPLYFYVGDRSRGQISCQDVDEFGGTWLVVSPRGRAVR